MSSFRAGLVVIALLVVGVYFAFTKSNPFANPYELRAVFRDVQNLKPGSPVRIAGVEVGRVSDVESAPAAAGAARVTMELGEEALPVHADARLRVRPRILLEGNFFVDLEPGTPAAARLGDGETVPVSQTATSVTLPDILDVLTSDVRSDLQALLFELGTEALAGGGAQAFNRAIPSFRPAYRLTAITNEALLGVEPERDLRRVLRGQQRVAEALSENPRTLAELVTDLNVTAGAIAAQDRALAASVPALRDTLRVGYPALGALNRALPTLRAFSIEALPGVRSTTPTLRAALPWIAQARALVGPSELKGLSADLRLAVPSLVSLNRRLIPLLGQLRSLSSCTNQVLVPWAESEIPSLEPGNSGQLVREQINRSFVGLAGESRVHDANTPVFHIQGVAPSKLALGQIEPAAPLDPSLPPPHRPDVACESQEPPNLRAPGGPASVYSP